MSEFHENIEEDDEKDEFDEEMLDEMIEVVDDVNQEEVQEDEDEQEMVDSEAITEAIDNSLFTFTQHTDSVYTIAIHPSDPTVVLSGGCDDKAFLWKFPTPSDPTSWYEVLEGHEDTVTAVSFNFNGKLALTGAYDGKVRVWDIEHRPTIRLIQTFDGPEDIEWATFHNKGNGILAGSKDGTVWLWFVQPPMCVNVFAGHDGLVTSGLFVNDGKLICTGGEDGTLRLWNPKSGQCKAVFEPRHESEEAVTCVHSDGDIIAAGYSSGVVKIYVVSSCRLLFTLQHAEFNEESSASSVECLSIFTEQLKFLATGGMNNMLSVWDLSTGQKRVDCAHPDGVTCLLWHSALPLVFTGCVDAGIRLWDGRDGSCLQIFTGHQNIILNLSFRVTGSNDGIIISGSDDHTAKVHTIDFSSLISR